MWVSTKFKYFFIIQIVCIIQNVNGKLRVDPLVDTKLGLIRGLTANDGSYSMFLGIPYAKVDEANPFGPSTPYPKFENSFEAHDDSAACPQVYVEGTNKTTMGNLDCLHLNIYVPNIATSQNRVPVMVFIHGGFFQRGFSGRYSFGPKYLVSHDVILITLNYRVGLYGFMCLDIPEVPGNQGLKDQALALTWIKENIGSFGGDPNKITLFGLSAGAHSVDFHLMYGKQNLFNNVILESGSVLASTVIIDQDKQAPLKIANHFGFSTKSVYEALGYLSKKNTDDIVEAVDELDFVFKPCVEKVHDGIEPLITETWINKKTPNVKGKSIMLGYTENEKVFDFLSPDQYNSIDIFLKSLTQTFNFNDYELATMKDLVHQFYLGEEDINENVVRSLIDFDSDYTYIYPIQRSISRYLENQAKNIYYYQFSYKGGRNYGQIIRNVSLDAIGHSDEIAYLFAPTFMKDEPTPEDKLTIDRMTSLWTNFAKYGDPTPETTDTVPVKWMPLSQEHYYYLKIDQELTLEQRPLHKRMAFWNLFYMFNEKLQKGYTNDD